MHKSLSFTPHIVLICALQLAQYELYHKAKTDTETTFVVIAGFMTEVDHLTSVVRWLTGGNNKSCLGVFGPVLNPYLKYCCVGQRCLSSCLLSTNHSVLDHTFIHHSRKRKFSNFFFVEKTSQNYQKNQDKEGVPPSEQSRLHSVHWQARFEKHIRIKPDVGASGILCVSDDRE